MKAYHIDRIHSLKIGETYNLIDIKDSNEFSNSTKSSYPEGLSLHGYYYLLQRNVNFLKQESDGTPFFNSLMIDYLYEYERIIHFPEKISRFQSLFVIKDNDEVNKWLQLFEDNREEYEPHPRLLEIEFDSEFLQIHDEKLLNIKLDDFSIQEIQMLASKYWSGDRTDNPKLEWLIKPPFKVIRELPVKWD